MSPDLYICNLPPEWSYAELHATFSIYGRILSLTIFKDSGNGVRPKRSGGATHMMHVPGTGQGLGCLLAPPVYKFMRILSESWMVHFLLIDRVDQRVNF